MKIKFGMISLLISSLILWGVPTHSQEMVEKEPVLLQAVTDEKIQVKIEPEWSQEELTVRLKDLPEGLQEWQASIWSQEDKSDQRAFEVVDDEVGGFYFRLKESQPSTDQRFWIEVKANTAQGEAITFSPSVFDWVAPVISSIAMPELAAPVQEQPLVEEEERAFQQTGEMAIQNVNAQSGTFDIVVNKVYSPKGVKAVRLAVWSDVNGQDDIIWYVARRQSDGNFKMSVDRKNHKNSQGLYHVHLYYTLGTDETVGVRSATADLTLKMTGEIAIQNANPQSGTFDILVNKVYSPKGVKAVRVAVWSDVNGQDDIIWYVARRQSDGNFKVSVDRKNHKNSQGLYHVHLYYTLGTDETVGVRSATADLTPKMTGEMAIQNANPQSGTFDILVNKVYSPKGVKAVRMAVWSDVNGQDDIIWYVARRQSDGNFKVSVDRKNHKNDQGLYHAHLYYTLGTDELVGVGAARADLTTKLAATISIQNLNTKVGNFDVVLANVTGLGDMDEALVAVWSDVNGQDDMAWYVAKRQANGTYTATIRAASHKYNRGLYHAHVYARSSSGQMTGLGAATTTVSISQTTPQGTVRIENIDNTYGVFDVVISDVFAPRGVEKMLVAVWSEVNGQNDLVWYEATKQSDGLYRLAVRLANHRNETGNYHVHLYIQSNGEKHGVSTAKTNVTYTQKSGRFFVDVSSHNGELSVEDYRALINQGISGVVVKLTESTTYRNPLAASQVRNAQAAGLKVSVYHYSHFTSEAEAQAEARYFVARARELGLSPATVMVNDAEENKMRPNINANMKAWEQEMRRLGYSNLVHYTGASWIDVNTLGFKGPIETGQFGLSNFWVAQYPYSYSYMSTTQAAAMSLHAGAAAWQFTSSSQLLPGRSNFDVNIDYRGRFTN